MAFTGTQSKTMTTKTQQRINYYYVASKYGVTWYGKTEDMKEDYSYPHDTEYFESEKEAIDRANEIEENINK